MQQLEYQVSSCWSQDSPDRYPPKSKARRFVGEQHRPVFPREVPTLKRWTVSSSQGWQLRVRTPRGVRDEETSFFQKRPGSETRRAVPVARVRRNSLLDSDYPENPIPIPILAGTLGSRGEERV